MMSTIQRTEGIDKSQSEKPLNQYLYLAFRWEQDKCLDGGTCPMSMTNHAVGIGTCTQGMTIPSDLFFGDACAKNPWPNEISAGSWISGQKFAQRLEIKGKGQNSYTERKIGQFGLVQEKTIAVFYTRMPRDAVRLCGKKWKTQGSLTWNKHLLQHRQWKTDWREKLKQFRRPVLQLEQKNPLSMDGKMNKIVVLLSASARVSWLQVWKQMYLWHSFPISTCWWWEVTSARGWEKKVLKEQLLFQGKKESKGVCLKTQIQCVRKARELGLRFGRDRKKRAIWRNYPKRWTSWAKSLRAWFWGTTPEETSRQADCDSKVACNSAKQKHNAEQERFELR